MGLPIFKMITVGLLPSPLKVAYYKLKGAKIGKNVKIGLLSIINSPDIEIGDNSKIGVISFITARKVKIGKRTKINTMVAIDTGEFSIKNDSVIMEQVVIGGMLTSRSIISIGSNVKIFPYSFINPTFEINIEDDVGVGGANYIFTHGSWQSQIDGYPVSFGPVTIKKGVWLPWRVFIMPNVTLNEYATIGAGSIITKDVPANSLAAGSPAKVLRTGNEYIKEYNQEERFQLMLDILNDLSDYITYLNGDEVDISNQNSSTVFSSNSLKLHLLKKDSSLELNELKKNEVVLSMKKLSQDERTELQRKGIDWFDVESKETYYHNGFGWLTTKDFLSRYGIRFHIYPD